MAAARHPIPAACRDPRRPVAGTRLGRPRAADAAMLEAPDALLPKATAPAADAAGGFSAAAPIDAGGRPRPARVEPGPAPMLAWIEIRLLRVDRGYQREIRRAGERNLRAIAEAFEWAKFAPVLCAPIEGGLYAVIDGQHRATAAAVCGFESVPCQIVQADRAAQAEAFAAVNGTVTPMTLMAIHRAAVVAGDGEAMRIARVAAAAGVTILGYPKMAADMKPHETQSIAAIRSAIRAHGEDLTRQVLRLIWTSGDGSNGGALTGSVILATAEVLAAAPGWAAHPRLAAVIDDFDFLGAVEARRRGEPARSAVMRQLHAHLARGLGA